MPLNFLLSLANKCWTYTIGVAVYEWCADSGYYFWVDVVHIICATKPYAQLSFPDVISRTASDAWENYTSSFR